MLVSPANCAIRDFLPPISSEFRKLCLRTHLFAMNLVTQIFTFSSLLPPNALSNRSPSELDLFMSDVPVLSKPSTVGSSCKHYPSGFDRNRCFFVTAPPTDDNGSRSYCANDASPPKGIDNHNTRSRVVPRHGFAYTACWIEPNIVAKAYAIDGFSPWAIIYPKGGTV